ncbi:MAG: motility protein A [Planctomycetes bacterium]|nr:motility protein A [Planctomycetota bacterium]NOG53584.1 motility protein A [Planctomycetota bacterium]
MDLTTIIGSILGWILILVAIILGGAGLAYYVNAPSMMIVLGGCACAIMIAFPLSALKVLPKVLMKTVFAKPQSAQDLIDKLVSYAEVARRDGILSLEGKTGEMDNEFIVRGIRMAVDGTDPELIQEIMESELENQVIRHQQGKSLLDSMGRYAPAYGMIGTLVGLVAMLSNMEDPSSIGAGMAAALLTTLYGALMANLLFLPMADKLALRASEEVLIKTIIIQGVMSIQSGDNPRIVAQKLEIFIPPAQRVPADDEAHGRAA